MHTISIISNSAFSVVNFRSHFIEDLIDRGCEVYVLAPDFTQDSLGKLSDLGAHPVEIYMERTGKNAIKDIYSISNLVKALNKINPSITFSYGIKPVVYGLWASYLANVEKKYAMIAGLGTLYVERDSESIKDQINRNIADILYWSSLRFADKIFFQNPDDIKLFKKKKLLKDGQPILINGSGVNINYYQTNHFQKDPMTFTLVARLIKEKGIYEFVEAARILKKKHSGRQLKFILLGDVDLNPNSVSVSELESWVEEGIVVWPGHVDNVKKWLEKTSVFVLPTYYREGTPKSILEAMAMSRPIITTDMPGCREAVINDYNGFLIPSKDVITLVERIEKFINNPSLINKMGNKSRKRALNIYDVRKVNHKVFSEMNIGE